MGAFWNDFDLITRSSTQTTSLDSPPVHFAATPQIPPDYRRSYTGIVEAATAKHFEHPPGAQHSAPAADTNSSTFTATAEAPIHTASSHAAPHHHPFTDCREFAHRASR